MNMPVKFSLKINVFILLCLFIMAFTLNSCGKRISFLTSSVVPAAEGNITLKKDKNNNYLIQIKISNLADVERLDSKKSSYVVWVESDQGSIKNVGRIVSSNNLNASFKTVSTSKPIRIFVSAEEDELTQSPGSVIILTTKSF